MAIVIEAFTVVVRTKAIRDHYRGGEEAFETRIPNQTFCSDGVLSRVDFMVEQDARVYLNELQRFGLKVEDGADAVLCRALDGSTHPACDWLQVGRYKKSCIAWEKGEQAESIVGPEGWNPDEERLVYATREEAERRLRFLRNDGNIQVFWDTVTEREVYVGRTGPSLQELLDKAGAVVTANLRNPGSPVDALNADALQEAIQMLTVIAENVPDNWRVLWLLGKAWHALGRSDRAYDWLKKAFDLEQGETVIPRELAGICLELGRGGEAVRISEHAVRSEPESGELIGNLALAYVIDGRLKEAEATIKTALQKDPSDTINQTLQKVIQEIAKGKRPKPKNLFDLTGVKVPQLH